MSAITRTPAFCTQCRSRCGCVAVVEDGKLTGIDPLPGHPSGEKLCPKGRAAPELVYHPDRLTRPMRRTAPKGAADPGWEPISWDAALDEIAGRMATVAREHGPEQTAFSVTTPSGTHISDSISWIERLIRAYGSPNTIYGTEICNWHKDFASRFTYGTDIGTPDFANTDCVVLWGNNPAATWLARSVEIQKAMRRGAKVIVVDPRPIGFARRADQWLAVRPGTDQALALGLAHLLIEGGRFDRDFMTRWSNGPLLVRRDTGRFLREADLVAGGGADVYLAMAEQGGLLRFDAGRGVWLDEGLPALRAERDLDTPDGPVACRSAFEVYAAAASDWPAGRVAEVTGVPVEALHKAAALLAEASSVAYYAWNGVGQSPTATQTDRAISLLYTLTGSYGKAGGNVPGGAASFADISGGDLMAPEQKAKALGLSERPIGPGLSGWVTARDVWRAVLAGDPYPVRMLVSFGTNLLVSQPDGDLATRALAALDFHVHVDFFENATARHADILLPAATSWEREGLRTGFDASLEGMRQVQLRPAVIDPVGEARSDTDIVLALAKRLGLSDAFFGGSADAGHDHVLAGAGLSVERLRAAPEGVTVPGSVALEAHAIADGGGVPRGFPTPTRRLEVYSERLHAHGGAGVPAFDPAVLPEREEAWPLRLGSAKTVAYCHSQHRNIPSLRRLMPDPILEMAAEDADARGLKPGDWAVVKTARGRAVARVSIIRDLEPGGVFGQHGWWVDGPDGSPYGRDHPLAANINATIDTSVSDPVSGSIPLRCSRCEVERL
ncbi:molybdopterin-containing oxidoreductase family protein [Thalassobaculum litoreum]|uniref:Anaerobic selenocysteine-containing dehydrogenase n=1 Tax=Thalassobaculum litoreum DSM 18839 TaxID=1123362 RepID=A0A8G2BG24_9PROT|nr:molybdopterin-dependent oxidoreductase [Thalassobaculum litoreum]SDF41952.1 Anaerobic selenocysteine-containing dehydrogenase [Thalassobaculum litoreum DSM 18839]